MRYFPGGWASPQSPARSPSPKGEQMSEAETNEPDDLEEPRVSDVPEPDQEPSEEEAEAEAEAEREAEPESEPEQEANGPTPEEWDARFTKAEARFKTYTRAVTDIWAEDAVHLMPFALDVGAPTGFIDVRNKGRVNNKTKAAALAFLGFDTEAGMKDDPHSHVCDECDGWGLVATGSKVVNQDTRRCDGCRGVGYVLEGAPAPTFTGNGTDAETTETGQRIPAATGVESPEVESLRLRGYTIIPPMQTST